MAILTVKCLRCLDKIFDFLILYSPSLTVTETFQNWILKNMFEIAWGKRGSTLKSRQLKVKHTLVFFSLFDSYSG